MRERASVAMCLSDKETETLSLSLSLSLCLMLVSVITFYVPGRVQEFAGLRRRDARQMSLEVQTLRCVHHLRVE